jgi:uroporphyrinogen III methyltransferase / synthase
MMVHPLHGKRIVITRPPHKAADFAARLRDLGAEPVLVPTIRIQPPGDPAPLDDALRRLERYDWLVVTSANAVPQLWARLDTLGLDPARLAWPDVAAIGPATAQALEERGVRPALVPAEHVAEALFAALDDRVRLRGARILLPQGNLARPVLADRLREAGARVDAVIAYETVRPSGDEAALSGSFDAVTFTSASTARNFADLFDDPLAAIGGAAVVCIGPVTAAAAQEVGLPVHAVADPYTIDGLIDALCQLFERNPAP